MCNVNMYILFLVKERLGEKIVCLIACVSAGSKNISYRKHQNLAFPVNEASMGDNEVLLEVKNIFNKSQIIENSEQSHTIHIEKSNRAFKHPHMRPNDYR